MNCNLWSHPSVELEDATCIATYLVTYLLSQLATYIAT